MHMLRKGQLDGGAEQGQTSAKQSTPWPHNARPGKALSVIAQNLRHTR